MQMVALSCTTHIHAKVSAPCPKEPIFQNFFGRKMKPGVYQLRYPCNLLSFIKRCHGLLSTGSRLEVRLFLTPFSKPFSFDLIYPALNGPLLFLSIVWLFPLLWLCML